MKRSLVVVSTPLRLEPARVRTHQLEIESRTIKLPEGCLIHNSATMPTVIGKMVSNLVIPSLRSYGIIGRRRHGK